MPENPAPILLFSTKKWQMASRSSAFVTTDMLSHTHMARGFSQNPASLERFPLFAAPSWGVSFETFTLCCSQEIRFFPVLFLLFLLFCCHAFHFGDQWAVSPVLGSIFSFYSQLVNDRSSSIPKAGAMSLRTGNKLIAETAF